MLSLKYLILKLRLLNLIMMYRGIVNRISQTTQHLPYRRTANNFNTMIAFQDCGENREPHTYISQIQSIPYEWRRVSCSTLVIHRTEEWTNFVCRSFEKHFPNREISKLQGPIGAILHSGYLFPIPGGMDSYTALYIISTQI